MTKIEYKKMKMEQRKKGFEAAEKAKAFGYSPSSDVFYLWDYLKGKNAGERYCLAMVYQLGVSDGMANIGYKKSAPTAATVESTTKNVHPVHTEDNTKAGKGQAYSFLDVEALGIESRGIEQLLSAVSTGLEVGVECEDGVNFLSLALHAHTKKLEALTEALLHEQRQKG